jgi:transposase
VQRLERAISEAIAAAPPALQHVVRALQALRGVSLIAAVTIATETDRLTRFATARQLMGYSGLVPSEHSSGARIRQGGITKTGNSHLRRIVVEAAWAYRHRPAIGETLRKRQVGLSPAVLAIAWKAQHRLHARFRRLAARGKSRQHVVTAVARELLGFVWAIGREVSPAPA